MTEEPATYETLHAGDWVRGAGDWEVWGVAQVIRMGRLEVTLTKGPHEVTGYPPVGTPVTVLHRADASAEHAAAQALIDAFGAVEVLGERWVSK